MPPGPGSGPTIGVDRISNVPITSKAMRTAGWERRLGRSGVTGASWGWCVASTSRRGAYGGRGLAPESRGRPPAPVGARGKGLMDKASGGGEHGRSEEHTSELESLMRIPNAVFCLKKKKKTLN